MKNIFILTLLTLSSLLCEAQSFLNGSFENTSSPNSCNYNISNATYNTMMQNSTAFGTYEQIDIQVLNCNIPSIPDGTYVVGLANDATNNSEGEAISLELSAPLVSGNNYILFFDAYSNTNFGPQGNLLIGCSVLSDDFGVEIFNATTIDSQWTSFNFSFTAPNNGTFITVMPMPGFSSWNIVDDFKIEINLSVPDLNQTKTIKVFPNPSSDFIQLAGLIKTENYIIYNVLGTEIIKGMVSSNEKINVQHLTNGLYFLKLKNGNTIKFIKG